MEEDRRHIRILSLDGGGVKGHTSLLILKDIVRTIMIEYCLPQEPLPCEVFDLITGASTGGLIAIMIGRLRMSIDKCLREYEAIGLRVLASAGVPAPSTAPRLLIFAPFKTSVFIPDTLAVESNMVRVVSATRRIDGKREMLRNYMPSHPDQKNKKCTILEAASATSATPILFEPVKLQGSSKEWYGGALSQNNPVVEAIYEASREMEMEEAWAGREIGCVVSIGAGAVDAQSATSDIGSPLKDMIQIMVDSEDTAEAFSTSSLSEELRAVNRYFRFNMPQDMAMLAMDEC